MLQCESTASMYVFWTNDCFFDKLDDRYFGRPKVPHSEYSGLFLLRVCVFRRKRRGAESAVYLILLMEHKIYTLPLYFFWRGEGIFNTSWCDETRVELAPLIFLNSLPKMTWSEKTTYFDVGFGGFGCVYFEGCKKRDVFFGDPFLRIVDNFRDVYALSKVPFGRSIRGPNAYPEW